MKSKVADLKSDFKMQANVKPSPKKSQKCPDEFLFFPYRYLVFAEKFIKVHKVFLDEIQVSSTFSLCLSNVAGSIEKMQI